MPIKAKFFRVCSNVFWYTGLVIPSLRTYIASVLEVRNSRAETSCVVYSHTCESGCTGIEVCTEAPSRSIHDYEVLDAFSLIIHMKRVKVQTAMLLLEMSTYKFMNWIKQDITAIKPRIVFKILDSLDGISSDIIDEFRDAYEIWHESGASIYEVDHVFHNILNKLSDAQLDEFFEKFNNSVDLSDQNDPKLQKQIFDEIVKRTKNITPDVAEELKLSNVIRVEHENNLSWRLVDFFHEFIHELTLNSKNHNESRNTWNNLVRAVAKSPGSKNATKAYEVLLNDTEQILNNIANEIVAIKTWSIQNDLTQIFELIKNSPSDPTFVSLITNSVGDSFTRKLISSAFSESPRSFTKTYTDACAERSKSQSFIQTLKTNIDQVKSDLKKIESYSLSNNQKDRFLLIISIIRKLITLDADEYNKIPVWKFGAKIASLLRTQPSEITENFYKTLESAFKIGNVDHDTDEGMHSLKMLEDKVDKIISTNTVLKDPLFLETMSTLRKLAVSANIKYDKKTELRNKFFDNDIDSNWFTIVYSMSSGSDKHYPVDHKNDLVSAWNSTSESERQNVIEKIEKILEPYIKEFEVEKRKIIKKNPPEAPEDAILNQYAFAEKRFQLPIEVDTAREQELYTALVAHFKDNTPIKQELANEISQILATDQYDSIFKKPTQEFVYRGMSVNKKWLMSALKIDNQDDLDENGHKEASFTFTPKENRGVTSWSISREQALSFANSDDGYSIFLVAATDDNPNKFVLGPGGLYKVPGFDSHTQEDEAIGIGQIKVTQIYWSTSKSKLKSKFGFQEHSF